MTARTFMAIGFCYALAFLLGASAIGWHGTFMLVAYAASGAVLGISMLWITDPALRARRAARRSARR